MRLRQSDRIPQSTIGWSGGTVIGRIELINSDGCLQDRLSYCLGVISHHWNMKLPWMIFALTVTSILQIPRVITVFILHQNSIRYSMSLMKSIKIPYSPMPASSSTVHRHRRQYSTSSHPLQWSRDRDGRVRGGRRKRGAVEWERTSSLCREEAFSAMGIDR